ncbi:probable receptor-like protein kinase At1g11050 [Cryptomeria japonica]|uniref:probable receptor-like protein kinase At1g11050 n=1 Tax=Cryptomeria japonica TaxID=3369 RepID=UPI0025ABE56E|nr:probable receptor-like protein kinase At1g11050 [Cryptomeria japonica]
MEVFMVMAVLVLVLVNAEPECPMNLDYVTRMPWNPSSCHSIQNSEDLKMCTNTLRSVLGVGLAQFLRDESIFLLPDNGSAIACLNGFQQQISSMGLQSNLVSLCFSDISEFVSSPHLCGGIQTKKDWMEKLGPTPLDSACRGDLSVSTSCHVFHNSRKAVLKRLLGRIRNVGAETNLQCNSLANLYAIGVANEFEPKSRKDVTCILGLPFLPKKPRARFETVLYSCLGATIAMILLCSIGISYWRWARTKLGDKHRRFVRINRSILSNAVKPNMGTLWFNVRQIKEATNNFSCANLIGQGSFGMVYKGKLPDGQMIAVKRMKKCSVDEDSDFLNEVEIISRFQHPNLVALRGFGVASDDKDGCQRFLVYDYLANGSLDQHIFGNGRALTWEQRKNIIIGAAKGLCYLHSGIRPPIYHRDIKAKNILLDDDINACVADFGLARMTTEGEPYLVSKIAGTHGYLAPEYALYGIFTDRSDVYSFGVLLLEIMSGRKALDTSVACSSEYLITDWAWKLLKTNNVVEVVDCRMLESGEVSTMERFVLVGILCSHVTVAFRPSMAEALKMLEGEAIIPAIPDKPFPLNHIHPFIQDRSSNIEPSHPEPK